MLSAVSDYIFNRLCSDYRRTEDLNKEGSGGSNRLLAI